MIKRTLLFLPCILLCLTNINSINKEVHAENTSINDLLKEYYNEGKYTRKTSINFSDAVINQALEKYFVANKVSLKRTTYFDGETLLMGNYDGTIGNGINSGYTTIDNNLYHYELDTSNLVIDENTYRLDVKDTCTTEFFVTMKKFATNYISDSLWTYNDNVYSYYPLDTTYNSTSKKYNDDILNDFLAFTASCFYNTDETNCNFIILDHVEIEEIDNHLELRLYADETETGKLDNDDNLLSIARVYKGFLPCDNSGYQLVINDEYSRIYAPYKLTYTYFNKGTEISIYDSNNQKDYVFENGLIKTDGYYDLIFNINDDGILLDNKLMYETILAREYNEPNDNSEGIDSKDLSKLKEVFDSITNNYTITTQTYFNEPAVEIINDIYDTNYIQRKTTKVNNNEVFVYNETGQVNEYYKFTNRLYKGNFVDGKAVNMSAILESNIDNYFINMNDFDSTYIDTYGPITVKYTSDYSVDYLGWTRISDNKYKCDRMEVLNDFREFLTPGLSNAGTYMTYKYVTVEILNNNSIRLRLYCNTTQSGKVILDHKDKVNKPNWHMLLSEGIIRDINSTSII